MCVARKGSFGVVYKHKTFLLFVSNSKYNSASDSKEEEEEEEEEPQRIWVLAGRNLTLLQVKGSQTRTKQASWNAAKGSHSFAVAMAREESQKGCV